MIYYKLTNPQGRTYGGTLWGPGVSHSASGVGELCTPGWLHAYRDPVLAVMMNPIHANFSSPKMFSFESEEEPKDDGTKLGFRTIVFGEWVAVPTVTLAQRVRFGILAVMTVYKEEGWTAWAEQWLRGKVGRRAARAAWAARGAVQRLDLVELAKEATKEGGRYGKDGRGGVRVP